MNPGQELSAHVRFYRELATEPILVWMSVDAAEEDAQLKSISDHVLTHGSLVIVFSAVASAAPHARIHHFESGGSALMVPYQWRKALPKNYGVQFEFNRLLRQLADKKMRLFK